MINLRFSILVSSIFCLVFISSSFLFGTPTFAARVGHAPVQEEVTKVPQYKKLEEPEIPEEPEVPLPEEPDTPEEPDVPEEPEEPEEPEVPEGPEEPEEPPKESEGPNYGLPSWIPSFPFPGAGGGFPKTENTKPTATKTTSITEETSGGSNKP